MALIGFFMAGLLNIWGPIVGLDMIVGAIFDRFLFSVIGICIEIYEPLYEGLRFLLSVIETLESLREPRNLYGKPITPSLCYRNSYRNFRANLIGNGLTMSNSP